MRFDEYIIARLLKAGFKPWQPRTPAGNGRESGRWIDTNGPGGTGRNLYQLAIGPAVVAAAARAAAKLAQLGWTRYGSSIGRMRWVLGNKKTAVQWLNRITQRNFTPEKVTKLKLTGERFRVENRVNPQNTATMYRDSITEDFIVMDDFTDEVLQIGDKKMDPPPTLDVIKGYQHARGRKW